MEKEIEENIYKRFPSLGTSPERGNSAQKSSRGDSAYRSVMINNGKLMQSPARRLSPSPGTLRNSAESTRPISIPVGTSFTPYNGY